MEFWSKEFVSEMTFLKYCSFDSHGDVINPKLGQKGSKLVFHVQMIIERWKSKVKGNFRWSIHFWNHYLKILKFWLPAVPSSTQKWVKKSKLIFHVPILIEWWKSKAKGTLRWIFCLWNRSLEIFKIGLNVVTSSTKTGSKKGPNLYLMY